MKGSFSRINALTGRNMKEILRDPLSLVFIIGLPLVMEILFYLIFHKLTSQFEMRYLAPGIVAFSQAFLSLFVGLLIANDRGTTFLTRLYVSPARSHEFIFAYALPFLPVVLVQSVLFFLVGGLFDSSILSASIIPAVLISLVISLFFISAGILVGSISNEKSVGGIASIIITGQSILSGMWFPIDQLGGGFMAVMNALPFRSATLLVQNTMNGIGDFTNDFLKPLLIVLAYTVLVFILAIVIFMRRMRSK